MAKTVECPRCAAVNLRYPGTAGTNCARCRVYFEFPRESALDRLIEPFTKPKGMIVGSVVLMLLFVGFWGLLHLPSSESKKKPPNPSEVAGNDQPSSVEPATPPPLQPAAVAPPTITPVSIVPATNPIAATAPTTSIVSTRPVPHMVVPHKPPLDDKQMGEAIRRGAHYLIDLYDPQTHMLKDEHFLNGENALCVYALLQCSDAITDPTLSPRSDFMQAVIEAMKSNPLGKGLETYSRSLRANALALIDRPVDRPALISDVRWLQDACREGAYTYSMPGTPTGSPALESDNSNTQYGALGVWAGSEVGIPVPNSYWQAAQNHWAGCQNPDGGFGYRRGAIGTLAMTAAGVASLCLAHDCLGQSAPAGTDSRSPVLIKAIAWMNQGDNVLAAPEEAHFASYATYGVARAGLALGCKCFGTHDWYKELGARLLQHQLKDGSFGDPVDTALALLFLARGSHPILFNKLSIPGVAVDHPRDITNLSYYATREIEHTFNSQLVPISLDWTQWTESPVLYLSAADDPDISDEQCDQLRNFVLAGGLLFTHADGNSPKFNAFAKALAQRLFPDYPYQNLPADHPLYSALFRLDPPPLLTGVSNGARLLMVNSPRDLAKSWDVHDWKKVEQAYRVGLNIFLYAAGNRDFRNRLDTNYVPAPEESPEVTLNVARLRYTGNWDPEPYGWTRFARKFQWRTDFAVNVQPTDIKDLDVSNTPVADLTGTESHQFSADEVVVLRRYVQAGGLLLIDSCGGATGFASSQTGLVAELVSGVQPKPIGATHPLVQGTEPCMDPLADVIPRIPGSAIPAPGIIDFGRGHIVITPLDLTNALLASHTLGIKGYDPKYAEKLVRNILLWAYNGQPER